MPVSPGARRGKDGGSLRRAVGTATGRGLQRLVNGLDWLARDPSRLVGRTPFVEAWRRDKLVLRRYPPPPPDVLPLGREMVEFSRPRPRTPVLLIPPLMVKPFIYDLVPSRSYVRTLLRHGFDVYLADFGEPDRSYHRVSLDDYVRDFLPAMVDAVLETSGAEGLSMIGYCMGGLFALMHTAANRDDRVRGIVTIGSPVDSDEMGLLTRLLRVAPGHVDRISRRMGNIPGPISSAAFKLVAPLRSFSRYADLVVNLWDDDYVDDFDALNQWTRQFIDYPGEAFRQVLRDFLVGNKLRDGRMELGDRVADLRQIRCPLLAFAGADDKIVPAAAIREVVDLVASADREVRVVAGGHMGMFGGRGAPRDVWEVSARWLLDRDRAEVR